MNKASSTYGPGSFINAMTTNDARTQNGMATNKSSNSSLVDLFFKQGALRRNPNDVIHLFNLAFQEDQLLAVKSMFYNRDIRGGQGERATFRSMLFWLANEQPDIVIKNLLLVPEYGRWDDLFVLYDFPTIWKEVVKVISKELRVNKNALCAKWMPREGKKNYATIGNSIRKAMDLTPRMYRKLLATCTNVVETQMCSNNWDEINYSHTPSVASNKYRKAFLKHDATRFNQFVLDVKAGKVTINASAIFPSDIVHKVYTNYRISKFEVDAIQVQWNALPDYMPKGKRILPVCDLSGSMAGQPMEISMALGIYLSERNDGPYKDAFITFSRRPTFQYLKGNLYEKITQMRANNFAENTDLNKVFEMVLDKAVANKLPEDEMPETILIISDMQFDSSTENYNESAIQMIQRKYAQAGYKVPNVVFWNVDEKGGVPVKYNQYGVALVSGYSPSVMKNIMGGEMSPVAVMLKTLNNERYSPVTI